MSKELTEKQIENWRKVIIGMVGPYALIMPKSEIIAFCNKMQENIDKGHLDEDEQDEQDEQDEVFGEKLFIKRKNT